MSEKDNQCGDEDLLGQADPGNQYTMEMMLAELRELMPMPEVSDEECDYTLEEIGAIDCSKRLYEDIGINLRWSNRLEQAGVYTLEDLSRWTEDDLLKLDGIGASSIEDIEARLAENDLPNLRDLNRLEQSGKLEKNTTQDPESKRNSCFSPFAVDVFIEYKSGPDHRLLLTEWEQLALLDLPIWNGNEQKIIQWADTIAIRDVPGLYELLPFPHNLYLGTEEHLSTILSCSLEHLITDYGFENALELTDLIVGFIESSMDLMADRIRYANSVRNSYSVLLKPIPVSWMLGPMQSERLETASMFDVVNSESLLEVYLADRVERSLNRIVRSIETPISLPDLFESIFDELGCRHDARSLEIYIKRNGIGQPKLTLEELGEQLDLTRERVRQIESKTSERFEPLKSEILLLFRMALYGTASSIGSTGSAERLNELLVESGLLIQGSDCFGLLDLLPEYECDRGSREYMLAGYPCKTCKAAKGVLKRLVENDEYISVGSFMESAGCSNCNDSDSLTLSVFSDTKGITVLEEMIGSSTNPIVRAQAKPNSDRAALHAILYEANTALNYDEMLEAIYLKTGRKPSKGKIGSQVGSFSDCLLWGRGTYIHENNAPYPEELLRIIANLIVDVFAVNSTPILGVEGIYSEFEDQLKAQGIPTHQALYSLLRKLDDKRLKLQEYPWICDASDVGDRTSFAKYFYSILEDNNGFITDAHASTIAEKCMAQSFALGGLAEYSPYVINANGGWYDIDAAGFDMNGVASLAVDVAKGMRDNDIISAVKVFEEYRERCFSYGVKSHDILYYLVDMMEDDLPIEATRRPHFVKSAHKGLSAISIMRMYINDSDKPVTRDELYEEFITKRKLNLRGICGSLIVNEDIVAVGNDAYWSRERLTMDEAFIQRFDQAVSEGIQNARGVKVAKLFYSRNLVLPNLAALPVPFGLKWNTVLLKTAFSKSSKYRLYGENGDCIVSLLENPGVEDVESFYKELLDNEFYGWSSFDSFAEYCDANSIRSHLEPEFFDAFSSIRADEISIQLT